MAFIDVVNSQSFKIRNFIIYELWAVSGYVCCCVSDKIFSEDHLNDSLLEKRSSTNGHYFCGYLFWVIVLSIV